MASRRARGREHRRRGSCSRCRSRRERTRCAGRTRRMAAPASDRTRRGSTRWYYPNEETDRRGRTMKAISLLATLFIGAVSLAAHADTIQFAATTYTTTEGVAAVSLAVTRTAATAGQTAQVTWTTEDGNAIAGTDYGTPGVAGPLTGTLNWAAGLSCSMVISFPITND